MKNISLLLLLFVRFSYISIAQTNHDGLTFSETEFRFNKIKDWISRIDTIEVTNTTGKRIYLLKQKYPQEFEIRFPAQGIDPGKTEKIEIIYKPKNTGKFDINLPIYHTASLTPQPIRYSGEIISFDDFALDACPSFTKPMKPLVFLVQVTTIDSATKKPLENSNIEIISGETYKQLQTDKDGECSTPGNVGYHIIYAEHKGYNSKTVEQAINPRKNKVVVALASNTKPEIVIPDITTPTKKDTVIVAKHETPVILPKATSSFPLSSYKKNNIIFLIDKSSSMNGPDRMPLLQQAMAQAASMMRPEDRITIITYSNDARIVLPATAGNEHEKMAQVIQQLKCGGRTEGGKAIHMAYKNAEDNFIEGGINQIILATDGGFNGLEDNPATLEQLVQTKAQKEIKLSVLAFGTNRFGKAAITRLAAKGSGFYLYVQNEDDAANKLTETIKSQSKL